MAQKFGFSRTKAQALIKNEKVQVDGNIINKPSFEVNCENSINLLQTDIYVSRGAYKLVGAIQKFGLNFKDKVVLDMGASTGGFTQVSLLSGAHKVYSVDVGHDELDKGLAKDKRVINMEGRDIRTLEKNEIIDVNLVVGDLSFISLKHILPKINQLLGPVECVILFKPQFECGKEVAKKYRGLIKDKVIHKNLLKDFIEELKIYNFVISDLTYSPIKGREGNIEFLLHLNGDKAKIINIDEIVDEAFSQLK